MREKGKYSQPQIKKQLARHLISSLGKSRSQSESGFACPPFIR
jgi:hypothetical protein